MIKVIIDTNVLVSALIQKSYPYYIIQAIFTSNEVQICLSDELLKEYFHVLKRQKFQSFPDFVINAQLLLVDIEQIAVQYNPTTKLHILPDSSDNKLLELAETAKADFLITGNTNDFQIAEYKGTNIVTPKTFWKGHFHG
jgi:putative PIN family toxin of toxin-antitoxin system